MLERVRAPGDQQQDRGGAHRGRRRGRARSDASDYYDANKEQFTQPEQRTIRIIQNADAAKIQQAFDQLSADNSPANWKKVAAELSTDPTSKDEGRGPRERGPGLLRAAARRRDLRRPRARCRGRSRPRPAATSSRSTRSRPRGPQSFDEVGDQIVQQINSTEGAGGLRRLPEQLPSYWSSLTFCGEDYLIVRCDNFTGEAQPCPDPSLPRGQQQQQLDPAGLPAAGAVDFAGRPRLDRAVHTGRRRSAPEAAPTG